MSNTVMDNVKVLLEDFPSLRDNSGELALSYKFIFLHQESWEAFTLDKMESKITRYSAHLQGNFPELRSSKWWERQEHSKTKAIEFRKHRNLWQFETPLQMEEYVNDSLKEINERIKKAHRPFWKVLLGIN